MSLVCGTNKTQTAKHAEKGHCSQTCFCCLQTSNFNLNWLQNCCGYVLFPFLSFGSMLLGVWFFVCLKSPLICLEEPSWLTYCRAVCPHSGDHRHQKFFFRSCHHQKKMCSVLSFWLHQDFLSLVDNKLVFPETVCSCWCKMYSCFVL